ncbi:MAG TPA: response regulator transcription factor [Actinomycetota bacterium]|jgi:DNA-binding response OmpR family regulator
MRTGAPTVLVVDDEPIVCDVLRRYLEDGGFAVRIAGDGEEALASLSDSMPDLIVLDLMLPKIDGYGVFRFVRERGGTPVIMLTARGEITDRIVGLELGADDYVTKPFSPREVVARVRAVLRRDGASEADPPSRIVFASAGLEIDGGRREVTVEGRPIKLTRKEFDLLHHFASSPGITFTRTQLLEDVWDFAWDGDPSTVTVHVRRLRAKIEDDPARPRHIVTVWGVGYRFEP